MKVTDQTKENSADSTQVRVDCALGTWMQEARQISAQCWCDAETEHIVMIPALAEAFAKRISAWMDTGAFHARNEEYWRNRALQAEQKLAALEST